MNLIDKIKKFLKLETKSEDLPLMHFVSIECRGKIVFDRIKLFNGKKCVYSKKIGKLYINEAELIRLTIKAALKQSNVILR